jgi:hypothetical protein
MYLVRNMAIDLDCVVFGNIAAGSVRHRSNLGFPRIYWARIRTNERLSDSHLNRHFTSTVTSDGSKGYSLKVGEAQLLEAAR